MTENAYAVIMAGGKGERFWPLSTSKHPKQLISLVGGKPLLAMAVDYVNGLVPLDRIIVVTRADIAEAARDAVPGLPAENVIGEPFGRDTAAACALATVLVKARDPEGVICMLTADHVIGDIDNFQGTLREACRVAGSDDVLITIGIPPTGPSTGFGYIDVGEELESRGEVCFSRARRFVEKPDRAAAEEYFRAGNFYWNSGMFVWSVRTFAEALRRHQPPLAGMVDRLLPVVGTGGFDSALEEEYGKLERISVDYAIMEQADNIVVTRGNFRWDDVGSWPALDKHLAHDEFGNAVAGNCEAIDSAANVVVSGEHLTALVGVENLVVVQAENATLICSKERAQDVKRLVKLLEERGKYGELL